MLYKEKNVFDEALDRIRMLFDYHDEDAIKADRITDNKISEFSEWVNEELLHELDMIDFDIDFAEFGLPTPSFDDIPSAEDFEHEEGTSDEEKQKRYAEFLERQATEVSMTTEEAIKKASSEQRSVATPPPKYYKCTCEKCGHTMFVNAKDLSNPETGLDRK